MIYRYPLYSSVFLRGFLIAFPQFISHVSLVYWLCPLHWVWTLTRLIIRGRFIEFFRALSFGSDKCLKTQCYFEDMRGNDVH